MALNHKIRCCKKCGHIEMWQKELYPVCQYCNYELTDTEYILQDVLERGGIKPEIRKAIFEKYIKNSSTYSEEAIKDREEKESRERLNLPSSYTPKNTPKCPTCGSTNVHPISTAKKATGFVLAGVFSNNFGKTMHCKQCGYKW